MAWLDKKIVDELEATNTPSEKEHSAQLSGAIGFLGGTALIVAGLVTRHNALTSETPPPAATNLQPFILSKDTRATIGTATAATGAVVDSAGIASLAFGLGMNAQRRRMALTILDLEYGNKPKSKG